MKKTLVSMTALTAALMMATPAIAESTEPKVQMEWCKPLGSVAKRILAARLDGNSYASIYNALAEDDGRPSARAQLILDDAYSIKVYEKEGFNILIQPREKILNDFEDKYLKTCTIY